MSILMSSRQTLCHTQGSTSHWFLMPQSSPPLGPPTKPTRFKKSPILASSPTTKWWNATPETESTWQPAFYTEVMLLLRKSMPLSLPSRPRRPSSLSTGAQLVSKLVFASSHHNWFPTVTLPKSTVLCTYPYIYYLHILVTHSYSQLYALQHYCYRWGLECT